MSGNIVITISGQRHVQWQCRTCGVIGTVPEVVWDQQQAEGGFHFCSNGHQWGWTKENSEREQLRRERDRLRQQLAERDDAIVAAEKKIKQLNRRAAAGTCPCCQRTFSNMTRHMNNKHPDFVAENVVPMKRA